MLLLLFFCVAAFCFNAPTRCAHKQQNRMQWGHISLWFMLLITKYTINDVRIATWTISKKKCYCNCVYIFPYHLSALRPLTQAHMQYAHRYTHQTVPLHIWLVECMTSNHHLMFLQCKIQCITCTMAQTNTNKKKPTTLCTRSCTDQAFQMHLVNRVNQNTVSSIEHFVSDTTTYPGF